MVQQAVRRIKDAVPEIVVITDVCLCEYTDHGHCGILDDSGAVDNDETLEGPFQGGPLHAKAGADMVAPSDMMDGRVGVIREDLDENGFENIPILSYAVKYASQFYGPFREAASSRPGFGDRKSYQMDPMNVREALREAASDMEEGADMIMVKPAFPTSIIRWSRTSLTRPLPHTSLGRVFHDKGRLREGMAGRGRVHPRVDWRIKRAGADIIITYFAPRLAEILS